MATKKPVLVQKFFEYENPDMVTGEVEALVAKLYDDGYQKIKVIVHGLTVTSRGMGITNSYYSTTVIATLLHFIDIDQK